MAPSSILITGVGVVSPSGIGITKLFESLTRGRSTASRLNSQEFESFPSKYACQVEGFNALDYIPFRYARHMPRSSLFGVAAAKLAIADSRIDLETVDPQRVRLFEGTSIGGLDYFLSDFKIFLEQGFEKMNPATAAQGFVGSTTGEIAIALGLKCRGVTVCSGSASSTDAIGVGFEYLHSGLADIAIVGGAEAPIIPAVVGSFCRAGVVTTLDYGSLLTPRAFTADRDGFVIGEGGCFLVLETERHAKARGAKIYGEIAGYGNNCDAYQMLSPDMNAGGVALAVQQALKMAGASGADIDYINPHGTGTKLNDVYECMALKKIFPREISEIRVSSTKPITGHLLGACGALEAVICLLAMANDFLPPNINHEKDDPQCDLNFVKNKMEKATVNTSMSLNYGFGGKNSALVFKKSGDAAVAKEGAS